MRHTKYFIKIALIISLLLLATIYLASHIFRNMTQSEPLGYYFSATFLPIKKGNLILTCLTKQDYKSVFNNLGLKDVKGECPDGMPYLLKRVAGVEGDIVSVNNNYIYINGVKQANSIQYQEGRGVPLYPLPANYIHELQTNEYFVLGHTVHSVDSRYFGVINRLDVFSRAIPIYLFN